MPNRSGLIVLMGSGELTATMVEVHKALLRRDGVDGRAVFIDTPAGFQLNVDHLSRRAIDYFQNRVGQPLSIASLKAVASASDLALERCYQAVDQADYILIGPGSPTYALRQWQQTQIPQRITQRIHAGGCLVAASAAALTVGRFTLPVYEIYKVGQAPHWVDGLNILQTFGFDLTVLPHWNNAEGGNHDTRFCFMGAARFAQLEAMLPEGTGILGVDEHTALIIDLAKPDAIVKGLGTVTLRRNGREQVFGKHDRIPLALLRSVAEWNPPAAQEHPPSVPEQAASLTEDTVWDPLPVMAETIQDFLDHDRVDQAFGTLLALERHIWNKHDDLQDRSALGAARALMRDMLVLIAARMGWPASDRAECLAPLVEKLLVLRTRFRDQNQWEAADQLRECLRQVGVTVRDTAAGSHWEFEANENQGAPH